jgi:hypothetical protein
MKFHIAANEKVTAIAVDSIKNCIKSNAFNKRLIIDYFTTGASNGEVVKNVLIYQIEFEVVHFFTIQLLFLPLDCHFFFVSLSTSCCDWEKNHVENLVDFGCLRPAKHHCVIAIDLQPFDFTFAGEFYYANVV